MKLSKKVRILFCVLFFSFTACETFKGQLQVSHELAIRNKKGVTTSFPAGVHSAEFTYTTTGVVKLKVNGFQKLSFRLPKCDLKQSDSNSYDRVFHIPAEKIHQSFDMKGRFIQTFFHGKSVQMNYPCVSGSHFEPGLDGSLTSVTDYGNQLIMGHMKATMHSLEVDFLSLGFKQSIGKLSGKNVSSELVIDKYLTPCR